MVDKAIPKEAKVGKKDIFFRFLKTLVLCIYPDSYQKFSQRRVSEGLVYFLAVLGISLLISFVAMGMKLNDIGNEVEKELTKMKNFSAEFELEEDIKLKGLRISQEGNLTNESILITKENIIHKHWSCIFTPLCLGEETKINLEDFESYSKSIVGIFNALLIALFVPIVVLYTIYNGLLALLLILIVGLVGKLITRNLKISSRQIFLVGIYASTVPLLLWPITLQVNFHKAPLILFLILSLVGFFIVGEKKHRY